MEINEIALNFLNQKLIDESYCSQLPLSALY